ncbi:MAG: LamG domain-containing protein [Planctomycetes bacterium]|nr:LamG domain-containing protein [Planctomycetota bacterium]MBL7145696.1 LamG domain-containing protein [Phycisphaerae bacterium]
MYSKLLIIVIVVSILLFSTITIAAPVDITKPGDIIFGVPNDSDWPGNEAPPLAIDDNTSTKYLHFKGDFEPDPGTGGAGFRVTPSTNQNIVTGLTLTTANDVPGRDPVAFELYGSNFSIDGPYTLIASGDISDFSQAVEWPRHTINETEIRFDNDQPYDHYQLLFTAIRGPVGGSVNSMQISEVELLGMTPIAYNPKPSDGAYHPFSWANLVWTSGDTTASHDVYFGDNFEDVNLGTKGTFQGNKAHSSFVVGFPGYFLPEGLIPEQTYYWRIDQVEADGTMIHKGPVWSFIIPSKIAYGPTPADGAEFTDMDLDLSWMPGVDAKLHIVYLGDNFDDVNNATGGIPQSDTIYSLDTLEPDKTYFWRVDELDALTTHKGGIWSFKTPPDMPLDNLSLVGFWKFDEGYGTITLDNSGYGNHGHFVGNPQWVTGYDGNALEFDGFGDCLDCGDNPSLRISGEVSLTAWVKIANLNIDQKIGGNQNGSNGGFKMGIFSNNKVEFEIRSSGNSATLNRNVNGGTELIEDTWYHVAGVYSQEDGNIKTYVNGNMDRQLVTTEELGASPGTFYLGCEPFNTGSNNFDGVMDDVRLYNTALIKNEIMKIMRGNPLLAAIPNPANGSTPSITEATSLSWSPGENASQHDVYFGTDKETVTNADTTDMTGVYKGRQNLTSYDHPEVLEWGSGPYYWRIDEYNTDNSITKGAIWGFSVADYLIVDDFESYNDLNPDEPDSNRIFNAWVDGFDNPTINGSIVGYAVSPFAEQTIVHGGFQSMPFSYNNSVGISEATLILTYPRDWTEESVGVLSLWFRGDSSNAAEPMYIALNGTAVVNHDNPNAAQIDNWTQWNIDLQEFGVNLTKVNKITLGFGNRNNPVVGGSGLVYFDDFRLYRPAP